MNSHKANQEFGDMCSAKATVKQQSVLENQIELLEREVNNLYILSKNIYDILGPSRPKSSKPECAPCTSTVASSLGDIRTVAIEAKENFEGIAKLLEDQLGSLKLEY